MDLIISTDLEKDDIDVRTSVLHDIDKQKPAYLGPTIPQTGRQLCR